MTKSKIFLTAGSLVLAISAVFATKASKKFLSFKTITGTATDYALTLQYTPGNDIFTTGSGLGTSNVISFSIYTGPSTSPGVLASGLMKASTGNEVRVR